jgi:hypothetical protein
VRPRRRIGCSVPYADVEGFAVRVGRLTDGECDEMMLIMACRVELHVDGLARWR